MTAAALTMPYLEDTWLGRKKKALKKWSIGFSITQKESHTEQANGTHQQMDPNQQIRSENSKKKSWKTSIGQFALEHYTKF